MTDIEDLEAVGAAPDPVHKVLGKQIKHLREQAGLTRAEFGKQAGLRPPGTVHVRDSKNVDGPRLTFDAAGWAAFPAHTAGR